MAVKRQYFSFFVEDRLSPDTIPPALGTDDLGEKKTSEKSHINSHLLHLVEMSTFSFYLRYLKTVLCVKAAMHSLFYVLKQ